MAEVLYNVAAGLILSLSSSAVNEIGMCWGVSDELDKLRRTVCTIEAVLLHAEELSDHNPQLKHWLGMLSEALYDADDLLDEFSTEALRRQAMGGSDVAKKVRLFFSGSNQFAFGLKMGHKVKALRERLDEIAAEKNKFHLDECSGVGRCFRPKGRYQTHSSPPQVVIGREHDKEDIVRLLLSPDCDENVSVISVVGIGGLGKTTLAQTVYDDVNVKNHFELKMWVCVSDDFDVHLLAKKTLESAIGENVDIVEMDPLKNRLHGKINGRKYLLVLDDVWNEDVNKWYSFKDLLAGGASGSKIVITTRLRTVAEMSRPIFVHELRGLSEHESWSLFEQVAFKQGQLPNLSLEAMGKEIVEKCCGVPLAIKTIGGVLYFKDPVSEWVLFKDNELSKIDVFKRDILPILRLSYNHLPSHYKHCFAYCSLYPKDFKIHVDELIQLWKAQGYVKSTNQNECLRDVGFQYFMDLFRLSFFQDVEKDDFGNIEFCKMHDLIHDLAVSVAGDNFSTSHFGMRSIKNSTQHASFWGPEMYLPQYVSFLLKAKKIRTILTLDMRFDSCEKEIDDVFCNLRCLRVLNLSRMKINALPDSIFKLKHLRYLDLSHNENIKKLPNSITNLYNLQALKLEGCANLMQLPRNITKLVNLTDLDNRGCYKLSHMPRGIGQLTKLEKLSRFVIGKDHSIAKHIGGLDELCSLNNSRGKLEITNLRYVKNAAFEFSKAHISKKQKLEKLALCWEGYEDENNDCSANDAANQEMGMEALCPHPNLRAFEVRCYRGVKPPSWLPSLTSLLSVSLSDCRSIQWLPPLDQLPYLKKLQVCDLTKLERIDVQTGGGSFPFFPSLTDLSLRDCPNLKGFQELSTEENLYFPCLSMLLISGCPKLTYLPLFPELKILYSDCSAMKTPTDSASQSTSSPFATLSKLQRLHFWFMKDSLESNGCSANDVANEETRMEALCPRPSLKQLQVCYYGGVKPPSWLPLLANLVTLSFENCGNIQWLPSFGNLRYLKMLEIIDMTKLKVIGVESGREPSSFFPSLTDLALKNCPNLKGFERLSSLSTEDLPRFPCLSQLRMINCPNLAYLPLFPELKMLYTDGDGIESLMKMPANSTSRPTSSPFSSLSRLQHLDILFMKNSLENELLQCLPSLQRLMFFYCSFGTVYSEDKDDGMQWQSLKALRSVEFHRMQNFVAIPKGIQYVTTLQRLYIDDCRSLACIPEWMPKLVALRDLSIVDSPQLEERCENDSAEDWPYISHIPNIEIGRKPIQRNGCYLL